MPTDLRRRAGRITAGSRCRARMTPVRRRATAPGTATASRPASFFGLRHLWGRTCPRPQLPGPRRPRAPGAPYLPEKGATAGRLFHRVWEPRVPPRAPFFLARQGASFSEALRRERGPASAQLLVVGLERRGVVRALGSGSSGDERRSWASLIEE